MSRPSDNAGYALEEWLGKATDLTPNERSCWIVLHEWARRAFERKQSVVNIHDQGLWDVAERILPEFDGALCIEVEDDKLLGKGNCWVVDFVPGIRVRRNPR